jgi:hypothetical protein
MRTYQVYTANDAGEIVGSPEVFLASDDVAAAAPMSYSFAGLYGSGLSENRAIGLV